jgi:hypothetical protein
MRNNTSVAPVTRAIAKEPWKMTKADFIANPPEGFRFESGREGILANRHSAKGETVLHEGFFNLDPPARQRLLAHEVGHDLVPDVLPQGIQAGGLMDPFKVGDEPLGIHTLYKADWSFRGVTPEEIIADAYSELVSGGSYRNILFGTYGDPFKASGKRVPKYDALFHAVAKAALKQGKHVPDEVLRDYPGIHRPTGITEAPPTAFKRPKMGKTSRSKI